LKLPKRSEPANGVKPWVKVLVLFHVAAITIWSLPNPPAPVTNGTAPYRPEDYILAPNSRFLKNSIVLQYIQTFGLFQAWDMFAPDPSNVNLYGTAEVEFKSGKVESWTYPRVAEQDLIMKVPVERYRKYYERAYHESYGWVWPIFAQRVAYVNALDPTDPPVMVRLTRHIKITPPTMTAAEYFQGFSSRPGMDKFLPPNPNVSGPFPSQMYFEWPVNQEQLRRDRGWKSP
jgi:hypothetical protein